MSTETSTVPDAPLPSTHIFDADTAVEELGGGRFAASMSERWWVERGPNGGYVAAVVLRAMQAAADPGRAPRSLTVQFPRAPVAGPVELAVAVEREGHSATFLSARLFQEGEVQATALGVFSGDWEGPEYAEAAMPEVAEPTELHVIGPEIENVPPVIRNYAVLPAIGDNAFSGGAPRTGAWIRAAEPRLLDAPLATAILDAWFPAPFIRLDGPLPAPTLDYTVHFRAPLPPPGATPDDAYLAVFKSDLSRDGYFEEDGELWSRDGKLLAHSRQLALLLRPKP